MMARRGRLWGCAPVKQTVVFEVIARAQLESCSSVMYTVLRNAHK